MSLRRSRKGFRGARDAELSFVKIKVSSKFWGFCNYSWIESLCCRFFSWIMGGFDFKRGHPPKARAFIRGQELGNLMASIFEENHSTCNNVILYCKKVTRWACSRKVHIFKITFILQ